MKYLSYLILCVACLVVLACNDRAGVRPELGAISNTMEKGGDFKLTAVYDYIRSQPKGGGVFIAQIIPGEHFNGVVKLSLKADPALHAELDRDFLNLKSRVAEITIRPDSLIEIRDYRIVLAAQNEDMVNNLEFTVEIFPGEPQVSDWAIRKRDEFMKWLIHEHPEYNGVADQKWFAYNTYPQIWIVEHWTFLSGEWEMRICFHVMIPPYDWSMMRLRKRGEAVAEFAARKDTDSGTIYEIPVSDYPLMFGY